MKIVIAILMFCVIVIAHELGHFLLAKMNGIAVKEFSIGFGPTIIGYTKNGTKYALNLIPFGGACIFDDDDPGGWAGIRRAGGFGHGRNAIIARAPRLCHDMLFM